MKSECIILWQFSLNRPLVNPSSLPYSRPTPRPLPHPPPIFFFLNITSLETWNLPAHCCYLEHLNYKYIKKNILWKVVELTKFKFFTFNILIFFLLAVLKYKGHLKQVLADILQNQSKHDFTCRYCSIPIVLKFPKCWSKVSWLWCVYYSEFTFHISWELWFCCT